MTRAESLARQIIINCDRYNAGEVSYQQWNAEQWRLWDMARRAHCERAVSRLVMPPMQSEAA